MTPHPTTNETLAAETAEAAFEKAQAHWERDSQCSGLDRWSQARLFWNHAIAWAAREARLSRAPAQTQLETLVKEMSASGFRYSAFYVDGKWAVSFEGNGILRMHSGSDQFICATACKTAVDSSCDCQSPDTGHVSNECPVHNLYPQEPPPEYAPAQTQEDATTALREVLVEFERLSEMVDKLLNHCPINECGECAAIVCPHGELLHLHHDGCPACANDPEEHPTTKTLATLKRLSAHPVPPAAEIPNDSTFACRHCGCDIEFSRFVGCAKCRPVANSLLKPVVPPAAQPDATTERREWVRCPICGEPDMCKTFDPDPEGDEGYIHCVNLACASNGGTNADAIKVAAKPQCTCPPDRPLKDSHARICPVFQAAAQPEGSQTIDAEWEAARQRVSAPSLPAEGGTPETDARERARMRFEASLKTKEFVPRAPDGWETARTHERQRNTALAERDAIWREVEAILRAQVADLTLQLGNAQQWIDSETISRVDEQQFTVTIKHAGWLVVTAQQARVLEQDADKLEAALASAQKERDEMECHARRSLDALAKSDQEGFDKNIKIAGLTSRAETAEEHLLKVESELSDVRKELDLAGMDAKTFKACWNEACHNIAERDAELSALKAELERVKA